MTDANPQMPVPLESRFENRTLAILVYALHLAWPVSIGGTGIAAVILAYIKRDDTRGTIWESHFENAIQIFWIGLGFGILGIVAWIVLLGWLVWLVGYVYLLYRSIKGLLAAVESRPYV